MSDKIDQSKLQDLIRRLERMRGPYMGDGINAGFTTHEVLEFLRPLTKKSLTGKIWSAIVTALQHRSIE